MITMTWIKDLVTPERPMPMMMLFLDMGLAKISLMMPQFLSKRRLMPPKRLVNRVVRAMTPPPMKVR
jgi:hypothetical protein